MRPASAPERGITLTEVAVTMIIGTMIMAGLVGFYMSSQAMWLDASTQAISQREATLVVETLRDSVRVSGKALVAASPDSLHQQLALFRTPASVTPYYYFYWNAADSLIYCGTTVGGDRAGPMIVSKAERFRLAATSDRVEVNLRLRSASGQTVEYTSLAAMRNR